MATDSTGGTTLAKAQINTAGYPVNGSGDVFIPHVSQSYKIVLYKNATDADNDTTGNADWVVDNLQQNASPTEIISDAASVTYTPAGTGAVATNVQAKLREWVSVTDFGAVGDGDGGGGGTDNLSAIQAAIAAIDSSQTLYFPDGIYYVSAEVEMPLKVFGDFTIDGNIKWSFKKEVIQQGEITVTGTTLFDSVWESRFNYIRSIGGFTIQSSNPTWGVFWNYFGTLRGLLTIDVDQGQSVNHNVFENCKGGIQINGTNTSGIREAHNNLFISVDTTGANITADDGTTGVHVINQSDLNQENTIINWYAEVSGSQIIKGNWNVICSNVDTNSNSYFIGRRNSSLLAGGTIRNGSFLSASGDISKSGDWSKLGADGIPLDISGSVILQTSVTDAPDGNPLGAKQTGFASFRSFDFEFPLSTDGRVCLTAFVYEEGNPVRSVEIYDDLGSLTTAGVGSYTDLGGGWYLLRVTGATAVRDEGAGQFNGIIRVYTTTGTALTASDFRIVGSYYIGIEATAMLPAYNRNFKTCIGSTAPTSGTWSQGDIAINDSYSDETDPQVWICAASGTPGTWEQVGSDPDEFFTNVNGTIQSSDGTVTIATIDFGSFSSRGAIVEVLAKCSSGGGGARVEYRRSLVNETGGGALNEQNIDSVAGANMTLTFNASGASLQLQLATAIVSSENFDFTIRVSGGGMLGRATINY
jgi:hypothetical protein